MFEERSESARSYLKRRKTLGALLGVSGALLDAGLIIKATFSENYQPEESLYVIPALALLITGIKLYEKARNNLKRVHKIEALSGRELAAYGWRDFYQRNLME